MSHGTLAAIALVSANKYLKEKNEEFEPKKMDNIQCCLVGSLITTVISGGIGALLSIII